MGEDEEQDPVVRELINQARMLQAMGLNVASERVQEYLAERVIRINEPAEAKDRDCCEEQCCEEEEKEVQVREETPAERLERHMKEEIEAEHRQRVFGGGIYTSHDLQRMLREACQNGMQGPQYIVLGFYDDG